MPELSAKQEAFCHEYLVDYRPAHAAMRAGYDGNNLRKTGLTLRSNPAVRARIAELIAERNQQLLMAQEYIIDSLVEVITRCLQGEPVQTYDSQQKSWVPTGDWKFDPANAIKAIDVLARYMGMGSREPLTGAKQTLTSDQCMPQQDFDKLMSAVRANGRALEASQPPPFL